LARFLSNPRTDFFLIELMFSKSKTPGVAVVDIALFV
jgi:hypothetical protein